MHHANSSFSFSFAILPFAALAFGCAPTGTAKPIAPQPEVTEPAAPAAPETTAPKQSMNPEILSLMMSDTPSEKAAPEVAAQFGRLLGAWACTSEQRQPDGTFKKIPGEAEWTWFYTLDGRAVQDIWQAIPGQGGVGTNLRVWDAESKVWHIAWATTSQRDISHFTAKYDGGNMVMTGEQPARGKFPAHSARITFHQIKADSFQWKYEATNPGGGTVWQEFSRLSCNRAS